MQNLPQVTKDDFDAALHPGFRENTAQEYKVLAQASKETVASLGEGSNSANWRQRDCPICSHSSLTARHLFSKVGMDIVVCKQCGLTYSRQVLRAEADRSLYELSPSQSAYHQLKRNKAYTSLERIKCSYVVQQASRFLPGNSPTRFLDIGAGSGTLLASACEAGWIAEGIEGNVVFFDICRRARLNVTQGYFPASAPQGRTFDVIAMLDVLEHVEAPVDFLHAVDGLLNDGGVLIVQVPNLRSLLVQIEGAANNNFCIGHWNHFSAATLSDICTRSGLVQLEVETIISEFDRILAYPPDKIESTVAALTQTRIAVDELGPQWLHDHQLGYKILGYFRKGG
jgi:2-polyprenyl-3-methyl-5-hydroxy-6-metoxy-1,4-benzoquinol methylase